MDLRLFSNSLAWRLAISLNFASNAHCQEFGFLLCRHRKPCLFTPVWEMNLASRKPAFIHSIPRLCVYSLLQNFLWHQHSVRSTEVSWSAGVWRPSSSILYICTTSLFISWLMNIEIASLSQLLALGCMYPFGSCFSLAIYPDVGLQGHMVALFLVF